MHVDENQSDPLKDSNYNLCVAKMTNGMYDIVWNGDMKYLEDNEFTWTDEYQVYINTR